MWRDGALAENASVYEVCRLVEGRKALFVDIGANSGTFSLAVARCVGKDAKILAVEPNPTMAARLGVNIGLNAFSDRIEVCPYALSDSDGTDELVLARGNFGEASLTYVGKPSGRVTVTKRTLGSILPDDIGQFETFVIKIDVEGHEDKVLYRYIREASDEQLPDHILIEVDHASRWTSDLFAAFKARQYLRSEHAMYGNALFSRSSGRSES
jgi:FkbM family methyltransferase